MHIIIWCAGLRQKWCSGRRHSDQAAAWVEGLPQQIMHSINSEKFWLRQNSEKKSSKTYNKPFWVNFETNFDQAAAWAYSCQHLKIPMKPTESNCPLVFEAILHDSTLNTRWMLKLFSLPIARLHSGRRHDKTVGSLLVPVYYPLLHCTDRHPYKQGIDTTLTDIHTFR